MARDPAIGDLILRAYLLRRSILIGLGAGLRIIGPPVLSGYPGRAAGLCGP